MSIVNIIAGLAAVTGIILTLGMARTAGKENRGNKETAITTLFDCDNNCSKCDERDYCKLKD